MLCSVDPETQYIGSGNEMEIFVAAVKSLSKKLAKYSMIQSEVKIFTCMKGGMVK